MALTLYKKKRSFTETPEPTGGKPDNTALRFVIQKHEASHLHYDFRLEMDGVLKSWAVPKGPSTDPSIKRLAMMVEDHPYDYRDFEGIIPQGQYGGGTVMLWDEGEYTADDEAVTDKKSAEKSLLKQLKAGKLSFTLHGKKLKGSWTLFKVHGREENAWLLMKHKDKYVSTTDITKKDKSVRSKKTMAQIAKTSTNIYGQSKKEPAAADRAPRKTPAKKNAPAKKSAPKKAAPAKKASKDADAALAKGKKAPFPKNLKPMLATLADEPFHKPGWLYEVKWDGYRALAYCQGNKVVLQSRNLKSFDEKFYPVHDALKELNMQAVFDGEIIAPDERGQSKFNKLQNWRSESDGPLLFYIFDLLWYEGRSLMHLTLEERRAILESILPETDIIRLSASFDLDGISFFKQAEEMGLEGIMAKRADSTYIQDRSRDWLKVKTQQRHEVIIGGFTRNDGTDKSFSSLLVGVHENGKLVYTGKIGTGFSQSQQRDMMKTFEPLISKTNPFDELPDINRPSRFRPDPPHATATFLKPKLVCEVAYTEMTEDGVMRHPSFMGMRTDKDAKDVTREKAISMSKVKAPAKEKKAPAKKAGKEAVAKSAKPTLVKAPADNGRKTLLNPTDNEQVKKIGSHSLTFSNLNKIYWPKEKITKRDMLNYYYQVAEYMLPYLKNRPQSLNRFPNGINGISFYQKDVTGKVPDWIPKFPYVSEGEHKNFMLCNDEATLLYMASLGCIEFNPWNSTIQKPDNPDWCVIDLDPDKNKFEQVVETALVVHEVLLTAGVESVPKTSGSTGIHIYIPLKKKYTYEESKEFGRLIATLVHEQLPKFTSIERPTANRKGKIYIDFLQNRPQATLATAYSLRPKPGATVSMPLHWEEVKKGLKMTDFHIGNAVARIKEMGDLFQPVLGKGANMVSAIKKLSS